MRSNLNRRAFDQALAAVGLEDTALAARCDPDATEVRGLLDGGDPGALLRVRVARALGVDAAALPNGKDRQ